MHAKILSQKLSNIRGKVPTCWVLAHGNGVQELRQGPPGICEALQCRPEGAGNDALRIYGQGNGCKALQQAFKLSHCAPQTVTFHM